jgi:hypothetical protein
MTKTLVGTPDPEPPRILPTLTGSIASGTFLTLPRTAPTTSTGPPVVHIPVRRAGIA